MSPRRPKPPASPEGNHENWQQEWKDYVADSYGDLLPARTGEEINARQGDIGNDRGHLFDGNGSQLGDENSAADLPEIEGEFPCLVDEGRCIMICIRYELRQTRYGPKDYLYWRDEKGALVLPQFFPHHKKYSVNSKAVSNYITAIGIRPARLDRLNLRKLIGLRAEVFIETVRPVFTLGALKGTPKPEVHHYSKVSEILRPLGRIDPETLRQLQEESR